jgi:SAM-dependent methyltransferase
MDSAAYAAEAAIEANHWWFAGRRLLFSDIISKFRLPPNAEILDVGTSTGSNLRLLRDLGFAHVTGVDQSPEAIRFCASKGLGLVRLGDIRALEFPDQRFDLVLATDVIEHVDDDVGALQELRRVLKPGGYLLLTVPAFRFLWGLQDEVSHHKRRYSLGNLLKTLRVAELLAREHFYFNYLLFPLILAARCLMRIFKIRVESEGMINARWLNRVLGAVFRFDVRTAPLIWPPIGVSALVVATRLNLQHKEIRSGFRVVSNDIRN